MKTLFELNRKTALAICVLSTVTWLPLAAQAQDLPNTSGHIPGTHMLMESRTHHHAMHGSMNASNCRHSNDSLTYLPASGYGHTGSGAGFAETDPASQFAPGNAGELQFADLQVQQTLAGFAETDPVAQTSADDLAASGVSQNRVQISQAGFSETDPVFSTSRPGADTQGQHPAVCPC